MDRGGGQWGRCGWAVGRGPWRWGWGVGAWNRVAPQRSEMAVMRPAARAGAGWGGRSRLIEWWGRLRPGNRGHGLPGRLDQPELQWRVGAAGGGAASSWCGFGVVVGSARPPFATGPCPGSLSPRSRTARRPPARRRPAGSRSARRPATRRRRARPASPARRSPSARARPALTTRQVRSALTIRPPLRTRKTQTARPKPRARRTRRRRRRRRRTRPSRMPSARPRRPAGVRRPAPGRQCPGGKQRGPQDHPEPRPGPACRCVRCVRCVRCARCAHGGASILRTPLRRSPGGRRFHPPPGFTAHRPARADRAARAREDDYERYVTKL